MSDSMVIFKLKKAGTRAHNVHLDWPPSWDKLAKIIAVAFKIRLEHVTVVSVNTVTEQFTTLTNEQDIRYFFKSFDRPPEEIKLVVQDSETPDIPERIFLTWSEESNLSDLSQTNDKLLKLICWVLNDSVQEAFPVKIRKNVMVYDLLKEIKDEMKPKLDHLATQTLSVWKLSSPIPYAEIVAKLGHVQNPDQIPDCYKLNHVDDISNHFSSSLPRKHLHIIVHLPPTDSQKRKADTELELDLEKAKRSKLAALAPPDASKSFNYQDMQRYTLDRILDDRPLADLDVAPAPLLYSGFGHFVDVCDGYEGVPRLTDIDFPALEVAVDRFADKMGEFFGSEDFRRDEGLRLLNIIFSCRKGSAPTFQALRATSFSNFKTDGHNVAAHDSAGTIVEFKNKITGITSIPEVEAVAYFAQLNIASTYGSAIYGRWRVPCLGITVIGHLVTFYAIILLGHQYRLVSLTPTLSCLRSASNGADRTSLYRAFAAASVLDMHIFSDVCITLANPPQILSTFWDFPAVSRLRKYPMPETMDTDDPEHGFLDFRIHNDRTDADPSRLLFFASTTSNSVVVIKFTRRYCAELHALCAKLDRAPQLLAFERLPGGWFGVAMEYIKTATPLRTIRKDHVKRPLWLKELQEVLAVFHGENLVHGDLRDTNIIVDDDERVLLLDFDWGGRDGETVYPRWALNSELIDGRNHNDLNIRKEDDERILAHAFSKS